MKDWYLHIPIYDERCSLDAADPWLKSEKYSLPLWALERSCHFPGVHFSSDHDQIKTELFSN
jgi:hypothetical protein